MKEITQAAESEKIKNFVFVYEETPVERHQTTSETRPSYPRLGLCY